MYVANCSTTPEDAPCRYGFYFDVTTTHQGQNGIIVWPGFGEVHELYLIWTNIIRVWNQAWWHTASENAVKYYKVVFTSHKNSVDHSNLLSNMSKI